MANLSGQTIQSTYPGLLNLNIATTGITSTPQAITDGLGNDTGLKIATNYLSAPNIGNVPIMNNPQYLGIGFVAGSSANVANTQNRLQYGIFYDSGIYSYSALTYNLVTASTSSDIVEVYFYDTQVVDGYGMAPRNLINSGTTIASTGSIGLRTTTLSSNLSFSGTGGGYYIYAFVVRNAGVTPTVRYGVRQQNDIQFLTTYGLTLNSAGTGFITGTKLGATAQNILSLIQSSYTPAEIASNWQNITTQAAWGFVLHTVR